MWHLYALTTVNTVTILKKYLFSNVIMNISTSFSPVCRFFSFLLFFKFVYKNVQLDLVSFEYNQRFIFVRYIRLSKNVIYFTRRYSRYVFVVQFCTNVLPIILFLNLSTRTAKLFEQIISLFDIGDWVLSHFKMGVKMMILVRTDNVLPNVE